MKIRVLIAGRVVELEAPARDGDSRQTIVLDGKEFEADLIEVEPGVFSVLIDGSSFEVAVEDRQHCWVGPSRISVERDDPRRWSPGRLGDSAHGAVTIKAAMPGKVVKLLVEPGQAIETGQGVLVVEAMKMQNELKSPRAGNVHTVRVEAGDAVSAGQALVIVE